MRINIVYEGGHRSGGSWRADDQVEETIPVTRPLPSRVMRRRDQCVCEDEVDVMECRRSGVQCERGGALPAVQMRSSEGEVHTDWM